MNFSETYQRLNEPIAPSPALIEATLAKTRRRAFPLRRLAAIAAAAAVLLATPALAAQTEPGYQLLYAVSPAAAQFFQPVRQSCTDSGVTMEVAAVRIQGDTAQAYITLSGETVDGTCDLFDSYRFHLPFDQRSHCQQVGYDAETHTAAFLVTVQTTDGSPIPTGGKMTFSVDCFLTSKQKLEAQPVSLALADFTGEAQTAEGYYCTGGGYGGEANRSLLDSVPMLLPGEPLAVPVEGMSITAAGYVDGLFHVQLCQGESLRLDNHGQLWLEDTAGRRLESVGVAYFTKEDTINEPDRLGYQTFFFDVSPEELPSCTLHGDFYSTAVRVDGNWRVTFPLRDTFSGAELAEAAEGHSTGSFDPQDTLLTFASRLEEESGRTVRWEDGFHYQHLLKTDHLWAVEFQCPNGGTLRVYLQNVPYEETTGLWQPYAWAWQD